MGGATLGDMAVHVEVANRECDKRVELRAAHTHLQQQTTKMIGVLGHFSALLRLYWTGDNLG